MDIEDIKTLYEAAIGGFNLAQLTGSPEDKEHACLMRRKLGHLYREAILKEAERVLVSRGIAFGTKVVAKGGAPFMAGALHARLPEGSCYLIDGSGAFVDYTIVEKWVEPSMVLNCESLPTGFWVQETTNDQWTLKLSGIDAAAMVDLEPGQALTGLFTLSRRA